MTEVKKKSRKSLGTFSILLIVLAVVSLVTIFMNGKSYVNEAGEAVEVVGATLSQIIMAPVAGYHDASDVIGFVFCLGAFLALVNATGALEKGIHVLVKKLHGKETALIPVLMTLFSIGGTTYGMGEETVGFYILLAATMTAAGMDPLVGAAVVLLGAGTGVLGSTINPFATGAAVDAATSAGVEVNMGTVYLIGIVIWLVALIISIVYVMSYAKKVMNKNGSIFTSEQLDTCKAAYGKATEIEENPTLTGKQKLVLVIFAITFVVMILGFIPGSIGETSVVAIAIGAVILLWTGIASWRTMFSVIAGGAIAAVIFQATDMCAIAWYEHLVLGGFAFGAVFMATDPVTSARTNTGKYIYGFMIGALAIIIRVMNPGYPEGMMLAILFGNMMAPLIDHYVVEANVSKRMKRIQK